MLARLNVSFSSCRSKTRQAAFHPIADIGLHVPFRWIMTDNTAGPVRWTWLIFAVLLGAGLASFSLSVDWFAQSWLDVAAFAVSAVSLLGVLLYAYRREPVVAAFWRWFRWIFIAVVTLQSVMHALEVAKRRGFTTAGATAFVVMVAIAIGWIYVVQWIAMTRLARRT